MEVRRLAVVGTGLIGASVALAAKRGGRTGVIGYDVEPEALSSALRRGGARSRACERGALRRRDLVPDAARGDRARAPPARARLRLVARGEARRGRPGRT